MLEHETGKANKFVYLNHLFLFQRKGNKLDHKLENSLQQLPWDFNQKLLRFLVEEKLMSKF